MQCGAPIRVTILQILLLLLLGQNGTAEHGWRPKQEYVFSLVGRTVANIPSLSSQSTGLHYQGELKVQSHSSNVLFVKFSNMNYVKMHTEMERGWWHETPYKQDQFITFPLTNSPVVVKLDNGVVSNVVVPSGIKDWELNFIQGAISQIQLNLNPSSIVNSPSMSNAMHDRTPTVEEPVYKVMENSLVGRCEVMYEVTKLPKSMVMIDPSRLPRADLCGSRMYLEVTKTRNYSNCEKFAEHHFGLPATLGCRPGSNQCGEFWKRASVTRITGCGDRRDFIMLSSVSSGRLLGNLHLHNDSEAAVNSFLNISLVSSRALVRRFSTPTNPLNLRDLHYRYSTTDNQLALSSNCKTQEANISPNADPSSNDSDVSNSSNSSEIGGRTLKRKPFYRRKPRSSRHHTTTEPAVSHAQPADSSEEEDRLWKIPQEDPNLPPHMPFTAFSLAHRAGDERSCLVQQLKELITDIASDFEAPKVIPERMTMEKVNVAIKICRTMTLKDLQRALGNIMDVQSRDNKLLFTERKIFRDVVVMCGTNPAFQIINSWIIQKKVRGESAAEMLAALPTHLQTPGSWLIQQFYELVRSSTVRDDEQIKISAILSFSNLLRVACVSTRAKQARYPTRSMGKLCKPDTAVKYLPWFTGQLRADPTLRRVYLTALGNTGSSTALQSLANFAKDTNASPYLRATAILSMKYQAMRDPASAIPILMAFYANMEQPPAVRIAAVSLLFYCRPELIIWQRIAISTWYEPSPSVAAYIFSSLKSFANSKDTVYSELCKHAAYVLSLTKPVPLGLHRPYNMVWTSVSDRLESVVLEQLSWSNRLEAANLYYRQSQRLAGLSRVAFEGEMWIANPSSLMSVLRELMYPSGDVTQSRPAIPNLQRSTRWIRESLKIATRTLPRLEGDIHFKMNELVERIFPFDKKLPVDIAKAGRKLIEQMKSGKELHYQKVDQTSLVMASATDMGFPVSLQLTVPWALRATGLTKLSKNNMQLGVDVAMMYTSQLIAELSFYTAWDKTSHIAAANGVTMVQVPPLQVNARFDKEEMQLQLELEMVHVDEPNLLVHHSSRPFTVQQDILNLAPASLSPTAKYIHLRDPNEFVLQSYSDMDITYSTEHQYMAPLNWFRDAVSVQGFDMMWPSLEASSIEVSMFSVSPVHIKMGLGSATVNDGNVTITNLPATLEDLPDNMFSTTQSTLQTEATSVGASTTTTPVLAASTPEASTEPAPSPTTTPADVSSVMENMEGMSVLSTPQQNQNNLFNASHLDPFSSEAAGDGYNYLLNEILNELESGKAYILGMNMSLNGSEPSHYSGYFIYAAGPTNRLQRAGVFLNDEISSSQVGWTMTTEHPAVPLLDLEQILSWNMTSEMSSDVTCRNNDTQYQISLKIDMVRSGERTDGLRRSWQAQQCLHGDKLSVLPACREIALEATFLDQYNFTILYNDEAKKWMRPSSQMMHLVKYALSTYMTQNEENSQETAAANRIKMVLSLAEDLQAVNVWVRSPATETEFYGIPINGHLASSLRVNPEYSIADRFYKPAYCGVGPNHVVTYDGVQFSYSMNGCWHVLTKDCSGRSRIAVLARSRNNQTELEVNLDNYKVISLRPGPDVAVNQKQLVLAGNQVAEVTDQAGTSIIQVSATPDAAIKLTLPAHGFTVFYSNTTTIITTGPCTAGKLCGVCGDNNGERIGEFRNPRDLQETSAKEYAASYIIQDAECKHPA